MIRFLFPLKNSGNNWLRFWRKKKICKNREDRHDQDLSFPTSLQTYEFFTWRVDSKILSQCPRRAPGKLTRQKFEKKKNAPKFFDQSISSTQETNKLATDTRHKNIQTEVSGIHLLKSSASSVDLLSILIFSILSTSHASCTSKLIKLPSSSSVKPSFL